MKASEVLKKYILIEIIALLLLIFSIVYCIFALNRNNKSNVKTKDGLVLVLDDSKQSKLEAKSDGEGVNDEGTYYTITNNNSSTKEYKIIIIPTTQDEKILSNIKVAIDDIYVYDLTSLDKSNNGYILRNYSLKPGYTKNHNIKIWYKKDTKESEIKQIKFKYDIETVN